MQSLTVFPESRSHEDQYSQPGLSTANEEMSIELKCASIEKSSKRDERFEILFILSMTALETVVLPVVGLREKSLSHR